MRVSKHENRMRLDKVTAFGMVHFSHRMVCSIAVASSCVAVTTRGAPLGESTAQSNRGYFFDSVQLFIQPMLNFMNVRHCIQ